MRVKTRRLFLFFFAWGIMTLVLSLVNPYAVYLVFFGTMIAAIWSFTLNCPKCKKNVFYNPIWRNFPISVYSPFVPRQCSRCGYDYWE